MQPNLHANASISCGDRATGVYGDRGGGWVTEEDEPGPSVPRTKARLKAESAWLRLHVREIASWLFRFVTLTIVSALIFESN